MSTEKKMLWRSLDELAGTPEFEEILHREFPAAASEWDDEPSRRSFLKVMGASLALAGVAGGCTYKPEEKIVPYVRQPEELIPGRPMQFATAIYWAGYARGVLVTSHEGRPTKIEGNPDHPATLGATDAVTQAALLNLYDPDRAKVVTRNGEVSTWNTFTNAIAPSLAKHRAASGAGLRILTGAITSPTLAAQLQKFQQLYPQAIWHQYEPVGRDNAKVGAKLATGQDVAPVYRFDQAKVIVSLDSNFLADDPGSIRYARQFIDGRRVRGEQRAMNRLFVAECTPSITGAMADQIKRVRPSEIEAIARQVLAGVQGQSTTDAWVTSVVKNLLASHGGSLVVVGEGQPPAVHAIAHAINAATSNVGKTVAFIDLIEAQPLTKLESLKTLVADMNAGAVETLIILGANPVYSAPADLDFVSALQKVPTSVHYASHNDETSFFCHWHLPATHELEMWSDGRAYDGTSCIIQPLIAPLYQGRSPHEILTILNGEPDRTGYEIVREFWRGVYKQNDFDRWWEQCLHDGVIPNSTSRAKNVTINAAVVAATQPASTQPATGMEIVFRPDPSIRDGRHANNGWLQELPKPLSRISWDNLAYMSEATARKIGVINTDEAPGNRVETTLVELDVAGRKVKAPAWVLPGQPDDVITVHLGYGRTRAGRVGNNAGFNAYKLRGSDALWFASGVKANKTSETLPIACVQNHTMMDQHGRNLIHVVNIGGGEKGHHTEHGSHRTVPLSMFPEHPYPENSEAGNKWGMVIDQNACIGCNACVAACVAENNIPVVGKEQVAKGREMHWLRIDTYFGGDAHEPDGPYFQPLPCMQCENAPCEVVCPVNATVHSAEGLNDMVYNRCIGTRYCSNNCPYKVRHFNFLHFTKEVTGPLALMMNPNVTVRSRGVMEKCTYCVQRINAVRIDSKVEGRAIKDGEVVTACAQACPTQAIAFGNLNDKTAKVAKLAADQTNYSLLDEELQTKPRTTYLPRYTNREVAKAKDEGAFF